MPAHQIYNVLMADDDPDDCLLFRSALESIGGPVELHIVRDGRELMAYLQGESPHADRKSSPFPDLIVLDLNMPLKNGMEALEEIKTDPLLRRIPVIILTTSEDERDLESGYQKGASSFIVKPLLYEGWIEVVRCIGAYWFSAVRLPLHKLPRRTDINK